MNLSRRQFLELVAGTIASAAMPYVPAFADIGKRTLITGIEPSLACIVNLDNMKGDCFKIGFPAHSFVPIQHEPNRVWGIEKWGTHAAEIDIHSGKVLRRIESPQGTQFYGHGVFWPKKNLLLISRVDIAKSEGQLAAYDYATLKQVDAFIATPGALHECHLISEDTAMVTNGGLGTGVNYQPRQGPHVERSGLVQIDLSTNKIVAKKPIDDDKQSIGHFLPLKNGAIIGLSVERPGTDATHGYVYYAPPNGQFRKLPFENALDSRVKGQMLSVAADEKTGIAAITNPASKTVIFVDTRQEKIAGWIEQEGQGMVYEPSLGFLSSNNQLNQINPVSRSALNLGWSVNGAPPAFQAVSHSLLV